MPLALHQVKQKPQTFREALRYTFWDCMLGPFMRLYNVDLIIKESILLNEV